ncbi:MAG: hypothetical protein V4732_22235 [Pseudomonadota bacterium]
MINCMQARNTLIHSISHYRIVYACVFLLLISRPSWALPITFEFTGTINVPILSNGIWIEPTYTTHPEWSGNLVRGSVVFRLDEASPSWLNNTNFSQYSGEYPGWMTFNITQPDSTILDIPGSAAPIPTPILEGNDAYADLHYLWEPWYENPYSRFYAQRTLDNKLTYPQLSMSLELSSLGESAASLISSANYNEVMIQPQFANHGNIGYVSYYTAPNEGYEYTFRIDSLNRVTDVPEPKGLTLILLAIGIYAIARLRGVG